jgi:hypothetical protein
MYFKSLFRVNLPVIGPHFRIVLKYTWLKYSVHSKLNINYEYVQFPFFKLSIIKVQSIDFDQTADFKWAGRIPALTLCELIHFKLYFHFYMLCAFYFPNLHIWMKLIKMLSRARQKSRWKQSKEGSKQYEYLKSWKRFLSIKQKI